MAEIATTRGSRVRRRREQIASDRETQQARRAVGLARRIAEKDARLAGEPPIPAATAASQEKA